MSHAQCGEDQKLKIDILVLTDIPRNLQGHTNKQNYVSVLFTKQHAYTLKEFLKFLLIICTRNAMNWPSFLEICFHRSLFHALMDHDILQWHTKHFLGPSKPNKKISGLIYRGFKSHLGLGFFLLKKLFHLYMLTLEVGWPHLDMP